jgi:hypothetical protein
MMDAWTKLKTPGDTGGLAHDGKFYPAHNGRIDVPSALVDAFIKMGCSRLAQPPVEKKTGLGHSNE